MTVEVHGLEVRRRDRVVLRDIHLTLQAGTSCALVGPNGAGKSTLLHALAGLVSRSGGSVRIDGVDPAETPRRELAGHVSLMPQSLDCPFAFSALDVAAMGRMRLRGALGSPSAADFEAARAALKTMGVEALAGRPLTALSGGERQRVHFAMQRVQGASVMLLDEPTSAMDFAGTLALLEEVEVLRAAGHTIVAALHDLNVAAAGFEHTVLLHDGVVADAGPTSEVLRGAPLLQAYGGALERLETDGGVAIVPRRPLRVRGGANANG